MSTDKEILTPREIRGKWGYADASGKWIIDPIFDRVEDFSEDLAAVEINGKCGYIDATGDFVIEPVFDSAYSFDGGVSFASDEYGMYGFSL